jgi:thymidylate synthase (FAD)
MENTRIERARSEAMDAILGQMYTVLDGGFVRVVDYMGNDASIVQMARVSYGEGTTTPSSDEGLIRYLMRHDHTSPFEGCEIKLHIKCPIFVARQWLRHRMANVNEYSGRYSVMASEFYLPASERLGKQSKANKQGTGEAFTEEEATALRDEMHVTMNQAFLWYEDAILEETDLSRELARVVLPLSTYTEFYWKIDLHNLFHFLRLRADPHAQLEIRVYADIIERILAEWVPVAHQAYLDYRKNAVKFSDNEMDLVRTALRRHVYDQPEGFSQREWREFLDKIA